MADIFSEAYDNIEQNKKRVEEGRANSILWPSLPKLSNVIPGIEKARYYNVTANSKVGKTQLTDFLFVYEPLKWMMQNPNSGIDLKIFYFSLEVSERMKALAAMSHYLYNNFNVIRSPKELLSLFKDRTVTDELLTLVRENKPFYDHFNKHVKVITNIRNPFGMYEYVRDYMQKNGKTVKKPGLYKGEPIQVFDSYTPNNPNEIVLVIFDHVGLITTEQKKSLHQSLSDLSSIYCLRLRDRYGVSPVFVQQQSAESEKQQFTMRGDSIINKVKPTPDGLGDNKLTQRDVDLMFGLFNPARHGFKTYGGYDMDKFGDHYRQLSILLNRSGSGNKSIDLFFHGAVNFFKELPHPDSSDMQKVYNKLDNLKYYV